MSNRQTAIPIWIPSGRMYKEDKSIRVDTEFPNRRMQHTLEENGFRNCGVIVFQGGEKLAYDQGMG